MLYIRFILLRHYLCCRRHAFFQFRQFFNFCTFYRSTYLAADFINIYYLIASTSGTAASPAAAGGKHRHGHHGGQHKGQELFHFHDRTPHFVGWIDGHETRRGWVQGPAVCWMYCSIIFTVLPQICHNLHSRCNKLHGLGRIGRRRGVSRHAPGPKGKTKPPADVVSPPGVYMQGSEEKHGVRRARPAQPKAPGRPHPNCVKSISQFSQLVNILNTIFSPDAAAGRA